MQHIQAGTILLGGGEGEGRIVLSGRGLDGGAMARFVGADGGNALSLSVDAKGNPKMSLDSGAERPGLVLEFSSQGQPRIRILDTATGKIGWSVTLDASGKPLVEQN